MFNPNIVVSYSNDIEYRNCIRKIVGMNCVVLDKLKEELRNVDEVSRDELMFDEGAAMKFIDFIYEETITNELFKKLFVLAAGLMLSEDPSTGIAIMFSYDYLESFYACLVDFFRDRNAFSNETPSYVRLFSKLK